MKREDLLAPEHYNLVSEMERYAKDPGKVAVLWENETGDKKQLTYENLLKSANKIGNAFKKKGLGKGDTVLIIIPRLVEAYQVYLAALKIGMIVIPCSEMLRAKDLQYRVNHGDVKGIISYHEYTDELNEIEGAESLLKFSIGKRIENWLDLNELADEESDQLTMADTKSEDMAFLSYTSGTTGNPKGVVHTHGWAYAHLKTSAANWLGISETDVVWATAGPGWQKWIWSPFLAVLGTGATGLAYHGKFEAKKYLQLLQDYKVNALCCTPTEYRLIAKVDNLDDYDLSHLHSAVSE
jgi:acetyl-CoA synthetase